jgi:magnesium transporter
MLRAVLRAMDRGPDGKITVLDGASAFALPAAGTLRWLDLEAEGNEALERLRTGFDFHPLAIEDCQQFDQRPKLEEYNDHLFLVTQSFSCAGAPPLNEVKLHELHAFLGGSYLVTVHTDHLDSVDEVWRRVQSTPTVFERGMDFIYYLLSSRMVESNLPILDRITDELEELEDRVLGRRPMRSDLARIFELKRHLVALRKVLSPQRDTLAMLARRGEGRISERTSVYFRDVYDQLVRLNETIESNRDLLGNALDAYLSSVSNRTNEIMKYLTLLSAVFLPLAFVVGFFGQNFESLPGAPDWMKSRALMHVMVGICLTTPLVMLGWFRFRDWI